MSGIAQHLAKEGYHVCGSDRANSNATALLKNLGIAVHVGESQSICGMDLVVKTSAVAESHRQIVQARALGIPVVLREELLGEIFNNFDTRVAVCGTHGKTTVTAMIHHVLQRCAVGHTTFVGGEYLGQNYFCNGNDVVVAEACEYNRSFLHMRPTHALCTNVEFDHPDCYKNIHEVKKAFCQLFAQSQVVVVPKEVDFWQNCLRYDHFSARQIDGKLCLYYKNDCLCLLELQVLGGHNVKNALATICLCQQLGISPTKSAKALQSFVGVARRWTEKVRNYKIVCDYAHHPTEIDCAIQTAKNNTSGKLLCVFQPHTYTRTQTFWQQFVRCFANTKVVFAPIFSAREKPICGITSQNLATFAQSQGVDATFLSTFEQIKDFADGCLGAKDTLLLLGAGDIVKLLDLY